MPWLLTFHIAALLCWCGALLYLPALLATQQTTSANRITLARFIYTHVATPAALAAVILGTLVFAVHDILDSWLIIKLVLVSLLVVLHLLTGWLVARVSNNTLEPSRIYCHLQFCFIFCAITAIFWLVLAKPLQGH